MKLSIIMPVYNGGDTIGAQLDALAAQDWRGDWELIVADNGSTDDTAVIVRAHTANLSHLRLVDASAQAGAGYARNHGAQAAAGDALIFVDADDVVAPGWLAAMAAALESHDFVASRFDSDALNQAKTQNYGGKTQTDGLQKLWYPPYYAHAGGCGLGIKKRLHVAVGGFDVTMPRLQDTDYCIRVQQQGVRLYFVPDALIHVRNRQTLQGIYRQAASWGQYNTLLYKRYRPAGEHLSRPWRRYWRDWAKLLRKLVRGRINSRTIYQLGWQTGLLKGSLLYRSAPAVVGSSPTHTKIDNRQKERP